MYKLLVKSAEKVFFQANDSYVLEVELHIFKEDKPKKIIEIRKLAFPLDISQKDLQNELKKYINQYNSEQEMFEQNKEKDRVAKQSDEVIKLIEGKEL